MAIFNRSQIPTRVPVTGDQNLMNQTWALWLTQFVASLPPSGSGYVIDGSLGTNGPTTLFQGLASDRGSSPANNSIYFANDTGQIFVSSGGTWHEQSSELIGDVIKPALSNVTQLATVNFLPGTYGNALNIPTFTVNGKGLVTSAGSVPLSLNTFAAGSNGALQINVDGQIGAVGELYYERDNAEQKLFVPNLYIDEVDNGISTLPGQITFFDPIPTMTNLSPNTTKGDIIGFNGTANVRIPVGSDSQVLSADSTSTTGVRWINSGQAEIIFNYGDATPKNLLLVDADRIIKSVEVIIMTPFNDVASTLSVGDTTSIDSLMLSSDNLPYVAGTYAVEPALKYLVDTQIQLSINPMTSTTGNGLVVVTYQQ